jgi:uncharacterized protein
MRRTIGLCIVAVVMLVAGVLHFTSPRASAAEGEKKHGATFEVYRDKGGDWRWRLRTTNSQVIATSGAGYKEKRSCLDGIESVKKNAPTAPIEELKVEDQPAAK